MIELLEISGDAAPISKHSSFSTISFAVIEEDEKEVDTVYPLAIIMDMNPMRKASGCTI